MSLGSGWAFPPMTNSRKAHWFRDGQSLCRKYGDFGVDEYDTRTTPSPDDCAACRKALDRALATAEKKAARSGGDDLVRDYVVPAPPGAPLCASQGIHRTDVRATVPGLFLPPGDRPSEPTAYCGLCSSLLASVSMFVPEFPVTTCVRCLAHCTPGHHQPCCDNPAPHGRPLCCHCYRVTHHVEVGPCH